MRVVNVNFLAAGIIVEELHRRGIELFCLSPGSRSAPLALAAESNRSITVETFIDERAAGYYAVGYARSSGKPVGLICTSGTAVANFFPAVVEAFQSRLPLVLLTADRPLELQNCGSNQTIDQVGIYGKFVSASINIEAPDDKTDPSDILAAFDIIDSSQIDRPIHINCRFREPLAPSDAGYDLQAIRKELARRKATARPIRNRNTSGEFDATASIELINRAGRALIIAGPDHAFRKNPALGDLSQKLGCPVVSDILSMQNETGFIRHSDAFLDNEHLFESLKPDLVLHFGGLPTSKRLNRFLLDCHPLDYIKIQRHNLTIDPDRLETQRIIVESEQFINAVLPHIETHIEKSYYQTWQSLEKITGEFLSDYFSDNRLTEPAAIYHWCHLLDNAEALFLAGSMPVRDADSFVRLMASNIPVGANRGASGIDGIIASACGFARGSKRPTSLIIGDLAMIHDINSLYLVSRSDYPVTIMVLNNNGGGIFNFLPIADFPQSFEKLFGMPHRLHFDHAAEMFDIQYYRPKTIEEVVSARKQIKNSGRSAIIEVVTQRSSNFIEHKKIRAELHKFLNSKRS